MLPSLYVPGYRVGRLMSLSLRVYTTGVVATIDWIVCILLTSIYKESFRFINIIHQIWEFSMYSSTLDLLLLCIFRSLLWWLYVYILFNGRPIYMEYSGFKMLKPFLFLFLHSYSFIKLLFLAEHSGDESLLQPSEIIYLIWNSIATIIVLFTISSSFSGSTFAQYSRQINENEEDTDSEDSEDRKTTYQVLKRFLVYVRREWKLHVLAAIALHLCAFTKVFIPYYVGKVVKTVFEEKSYEKLYEAVGVMVAVHIIAIIFGCMRGALCGYLQYFIGNLIRQDLYNAFLNSEIAFFDANKTGVLMSRFSSDVETLASTLPGNLNTFLRNFSLLIGSLAFMLFLSWRLTLISLIIFPYIWLLTDVLGAMYEENVELTQKLTAKSNDVSQEVISTMRTVRSFAAESSESDRYYLKTTDTYHTFKKRGVLVFKYIALIESFTALNLTLVMWYGGHLVMTKRFEPEMLVSFTIYHLVMISNIQEMSNVVTGLFQSVGASRKVFEYIDREPAFKHQGTLKPEKLEGRIEFQDVHFTYPTRNQNNVLKGISFSVEAGEVVALVGPSGSGKSTCISLLEHFYEAHSGKILIDGIPLEDYEYQYFHQKIALVGQEPVLFGQSVTKNIIYGLDNKTETDVVNAAELANAHSFIMEQTHKYETNVGEKGGQLSGGQKQRVAIARALIRRPTILLLDEATSALDTESEYLVQDAIYKNLSGHTVLLVAHRLSTVEKADKIIVLDKGQIVETGKHAELISKNGVYANLVRRQLMKTDDAYYLKKSRPWTIPKTKKYAKSDPRSCRSY